MSSKTRKMLSDWQAPYIMALMRQIETQSKATLAHWAVDYAEATILPLWETRFPADLRPRKALDSARQWLKGEIKLPQAKPIILECHAAARECTDDPTAQAAARAIGQCASTIHSAQHCLGLALYGALALAYEAKGIKAPWAELERHAGKECELMLEALIKVSIPDEPKPAKINWFCKCSHSPGINSLVYPV